MVIYLEILKLKNVEERDYRSFLLLIHLLTLTLRAVDQEHLKSFRNVVLEKDGED
jgi:hypothetical protein